MRTHSTPVASSLRALAPFALLLLAACSSGGGDSGGGGGTPTPTYIIGGSVTGLTGTVTLQNNGVETLSVSANGAFAFNTKINSGAVYSVTVLAQPSGQTCSAINNSGTATADVTTVTVTCSSNPPRSISGSVSGMTGTGLVLLSNTGETLAISANGPFNFITPVADGAGFSVTVQTPPTGQGCVVAFGTGIANANITNVAVTCSAITYGVRAMVSGLAAGKTVTLQNNGIDPYTVNMNSTILFPIRFADGAAYSVTVRTQPVAQTCTVDSIVGTGTIAGADVTVPVTCSANTWQVSGTTFGGGGVTGLIGTVVLMNNTTGETINMAATGDFFFNTKIAQGSSYSVSVVTQPTNQLCTVTNGSGTNIMANVTNIAVDCVNTYLVGGTIYSTSAAGGGPTLLNSSPALPNGGEALAIDAILLNPAVPPSFTFATRLPVGSSYAVTQSIRASSPTQNCTVTGGDNGTGGGTVPAGDVTSISVVCSALSVLPKYAFVANSTAGGMSSDTVSTHSIGSGTGALGAAVTAATQNEPIAVAVDPTGKFAYVVNRSSNSISAYSIDAATGALTAIDANGGVPLGVVMMTPDVPVSIAIHPSGKFAYVVSQGNGSSIPTAISAYAINTTTGPDAGSLAQIDLDTASSSLNMAAGLKPYAVTVDPTGRFAYVANYDSATVAAYAINQTTGTLASIGSIATGTGPSSVAVDPAGNCALVANNISDNVSAYTINQTTGALTAATGSPFLAGTSPRSVAIDPALGRYAYVANSGGQTVSTASWTSGSVTTFTTSAPHGYAVGDFVNVTGVTPNGFNGTHMITAVSGSNFVVGIAVNPGAYVSGGAVAEGSVSAFSLDTATCVLTPVGSIGAGTTPLSINIDPTGAFVYVANFGSSNISAYQIGGTGALSAVGLAATGAGPVSITTIAQ